MSTPYRQLILCGRIVQAMNYPVPKQLGKSINFMCTLSLDYLSIMVFFFVIVAGLIHANHEGKIIDYLIQQLKNATTDVSFLILCKNYNFMYSTKKKVLNNLKIKLYSNRKYPYRVYLPQEGRSMEIPRGEGGREGQKQKTSFKRNMWS